MWQEAEKGPYIVLAPSEAAFSQLTRKELRQLSRGNDLAYHLIPLRGQPAPEVTNDSTFKTLLGPELRFNVYGNSVFVNGVAVSRGDLPFSHGTIQVRATPTHQEKCPFKKKMKIIVCNILRQTLPPLQRQPEYSL